MIYSFLVHFILLVHPPIQDMTSTKFKLPEIWSNDFTITVSRGGGMLDERLDIKFTYDSCKFNHRVQGSQKENAFLMTNDSRAAVLKKLHELKVSKIQTDFSGGLVYDKATSTIGFNYNNQSFIIQDSASSKIKERYKGDFNLAFYYLQMFAMEKHKD